jgi:hypothetical protein
MILQSGEHQAEAEDRKRKSPALKDATHNRVDGALRAEG